MLTVKICPTAIYKKTWILPIYIALSSALWSSAPGVFLARWFNKPSSVHWERNCLDPLQETGIVGTLMCTEPRVCTCCSMWYISCSFLVQPLGLILEIASVTPNVSTKVPLTIIPLNNIYSGKRIVSRVWFFTLLPRCCLGALSLAHIVLISRVWLLMLQLCK